MSIIMVFLQEGTQKAEESHAVLPVGVSKVCDRGVGIPLAHQTRIFERFYRVDEARSRNTGGTGLGLSIVKTLVEGMGGTIAVISQVNQGTTFTILLPLSGS